MPSSPRLPAQLPRLPACHGVLCFKIKRAYKRVEFEVYKEHMVSALLVEGKAGAVQNAVAKLQDRDKHVQLEPVPW